MYVGRSILRSLTTRIESGRINFSMKCGNVKSYVRTAMLFVRISGGTMLQPLGARLLVKRIDAPRPTSSLIEIPETVDGEKSCYAVVLAVGTKVVEAVKVADTIILAQYSGSPATVELDGEMLDATIVMQDDVLAVVTEE